MFSIKLSGNTALAGSWVPFAKVKAVQFDRLLSAGGKKTLAVGNSGFITFRKRGKVYYILIQASGGIGYEFLFCPQFLQFDVTPTPNTIDFYDQLMAGETGMNLLAPIAQFALVGFQGIDPTTEEPIFDIRSPGVTEGGGISGGPAISMLGFTMYDWADGYNFTWHPGERHGNQLATSKTIINPHAAFYTGMPWLNQLDHDYHVASYREDFAYFETFFDPNNLLDWTIPTEDPGPYQYMLSANEMTRRRIGMREHLTLNQPTPWGERMRVGGNPKVQELPAAQRLEVQGDPSRGYTPITISSGAVFVNAMVQAYKAKDSTDLKIINQVTGEITTVTLPLWTLDDERDTPIQWKQNTAGTKIIACMHGASFLREEFDWENIVQLDMGTLADAVSHPRFAELLNKLDFYSTVSSQPRLPANLHVGKDSRGVVELELGVIVDSEGTPTITAQVGRTFFEEGSFVVDAAYAYNTDTPRLIKLDAKITGWVSMSELMYLTAPRFGVPEVAGEMFDLLAIYAQWHEMDVSGNLLPYWRRVLMHNAPFNLALGRNQTFTIFPSTPSEKDVDTLYSFSNSASYVYLVDDPSGTPGDTGNIVTDVDNVTDGGSHMPFMYPAVYMETVRSKQLNDNGYTSADGSTQVTDPRWLKHRNQVPKNANGYFYAPISGEDFIPMCPADRWHYFADSTVGKDFTTYPLTYPKRYVKDALRTHLHTFRGDGVEIQRKLVAVDLEFDCYVMRYREKILDHYYWPPDWETKIERATGPISNDAYDVNDQLNTGGYRYNGTDWYGNGRTRARAYRYASEVVVHGGAVETTCAGATFTPHTEVVLPENYFTLNPLHAKWHDYIRVTIHDGLDNRFMQCCASFPMPNTVENRYLFHTYPLRDSFLALLGPVNAVANQPLLIIQSAAHWELGMKDFGFIKGYEDGSVACSVAPLPHFWGIPDGKTEWTLTDNDLWLGIEGYPAIDFIRFAYTDPVTQQPAYAEISHQEVVNSLWTGLGGTVTHTNVDLVAAGGVWGHALTGEEDGGN